MVFNSQQMNMGEALYSAKDKLHAQNLSPLVRGTENSLPSVTRVFSRGRDMYAFLQVYGNQQPVALVVTFFMDGKKVWNIQPAAASAGNDHSIQSPQQKAGLQPHTAKEPHRIPTLRLI